MALTVKKTYEHLAADMGMTRDLVREIEVTALRKMRYPSCLLELKNVCGDVGSHDADMKGGFDMDKNILKRNDGIFIGFAELDKCLKGMRGGELLLVGGRPAMGKTAFALNIVNHLTVGKDVPCLYYLLENSKEYVKERLKRIGGDETYERLEVSKDLPLYIEDKSSISMDDFCSIVREHKKKHNIAFVVIDYIQILVERQTFHRNISDLKKLAVELDVPIMMLSTLSRDIDERDDKRPVMSDLGSFEAIQQLVDVIMFIYRDAYYNFDTAKPNTAEIIIAKNNNEDIGPVELGFAEERYFDQTEC